MMPLLKQNRQLTFERDVREVLDPLQNKFAVNVDERLVGRIHPVELLGVGTRRSRELVAGMRSFHRAASCLGSKP
jgi:hypothetical protein